MRVLGRSYIINSERIQEIFSKYGKQNGYDMKKITVIGANSYIARNVIYTLMNKDEKYSLKLYDMSESFVDDDLYVKKENISGDSNNQKGYSTYVYSSVDIRSLESVSTIDMDCDIIYMFVGKTGSANGFDDPDLFIDINERALLNVLNAYRNQPNLPKIVFPSTRLVYKGKPGPQKEDAEKEFKTIYAINKYACETYLEQYERVFGIKYAIFRICIPYGTMIPGATSYGTAEFMLGKATNGENISLYGDGSQRRTLTYMGDLCEALIAGAESEKCINDVYNIGGEDYSLAEMAELIAGKYEVEVVNAEWPEVALKIESGDTVFDDTKLQGCIGNVTTSKFVDWIDR